MHVVAVRILVVVALALGFVAAANWFASPQLPAAAFEALPNAPLRLQLFPLLVFQFIKIGPDGGLAVAYAIFALSATTLLLALLLAGWLAWHGLQRASVRHLTAALAFASIAVAYFWFLREFAPQRDLLLPWRRVLDPIAMCAGMYALLAFVACFRIYPEAFSRELVRRDGAIREVERVAAIERVRRGDGVWRYWSWLPSEHYGVYGRAQQPALRGLTRLVRSRELLWLVAAFAFGLSGFLYAPLMSDGPLLLRMMFWSAVGAGAVLIVDPISGLRVDQSPLVRWFQQRDHTHLFDVERVLHDFFSRPLGLAVVTIYAIALTALWHRGGKHAVALTALLALVTVIVLLGHALSLLYLNWRHGPAEHRRAIGWIFLGSAGATSIWMAAEIVAGLMMFALKQTDWFASSERWFGAVIALGPPLIALAFVLSLWASILHHGSFDPELALRRGAGYTVLGVALTAIFVAVEGAVSSLVVVHLGMPSQTGPVLAGTAVALGFGPLRERVDRGVQRVMQRLLPPEAVAAGERRECAIVFSDLSGYTRLAEIDEEEAVTLAAILHRNARAVADANGGRVVKTIGDAVLCVYPDAASALSASVALHAGYRRECAARDSEALPVHSGLHVGELVIAPDGDVFGASVNLAARLQTLAGADELIASNTAAAAITASGLAAEALPARRFKNIAEPVDCLRVRLA